MAITSNLGITKLEPGVNQAHVTVNEGFDLFDSAIAGVTNIDLSAADTVTLSGGESTRHILLAKNATKASWVVVQKQPKTWVFINQCSFSVTVQTSGQASPPTIAAGATKHLVCDGTDIILVS